MTLQSVKFGLPLAAVMLTPLLAGPAAAQDWTGLYAGGNLGGGWGDASAHTSTVFSSTGYFASTSPPAINAVGAQSLTPQGGTIGIDAGFNVQNGDWVFGVQGDVSSFSFSDSMRDTGIYPCCGPTNFTVSQRLSTDYLVTARAPDTISTTPDWETRSPM
jgi:outer membrane immunogenic protein